MVLKNISKRKVSRINWNLFLISDAHFIDVTLRDYVFSISLVVYYNSSEMEFF